ncbi:hypothetical protein Mal15_23160 [Stieleria maiorica]|uniref:Zinc finger/thioredoxin putative domain-containing protein n=1 Tax=Stieleria maiorica TaxID=2795974 RepID=A0A5B9MGS3_9BACT|nr:hypothetical protein [Stieleria maiorica]QEF98267.1 hypothetical protein Mal15_23160 [Stieleria maiorica]
MLTIKCPKCATLMKLQQQAVAVKVKCPKCQTVLKVPGKKSPSPAADTQQPAAQTAAPTESAAATKPAAKKRVANKPAAAKPAAKASSPAASAARRTAKKRKPAAQQVPAAAPAESPFVDENPFANLPSGGFDTASAAADPFGADPFAADPLAADPLAASPAAAPAAGGFDFGNLDVPAAGAVAAGGFPAAAVPAASGAAFPAAAGPLAAASPAANPAAGAKNAGTKKPINKKLLWIAAGSGAAVVVLGLVIGLTVMAVKSKRSRQTASSAAEAVEAPAGFQSGSVNRVSFVVPEGNAVEEPPTSIEAQVFESAATGATFLVAVDTYEYLNPSDMQLAYRAGRMIMSDVYGGERVERNGHAGMKGSSSGGMTLTDMTVEYYLVGDQVILFGCGIPRVEWSEEDLEEGRPPEPSEEEKAKQEAFQAEMETFFDSVRI